LCCCCCCVGGDRYINGCLEWVMENMWVYAGAGFAGLLWGMGTIRGEMAVAFMAGVFVTNSNVAVWAVIAMIAGYMVGNMLLSRKEQTTT